MSVVRETFEFSKRRSHSGIASCQRLPNVRISSGRERKCLPKKQQPKKALQRSRPPRKLQKHSLRDRHAPARMFTAIQREKRNSLDAEYQHQETSTMRGAITGPIRLLRLMHSRRRNKRRKKPPLGKANLTDGQKPGMMQSTGDTV